MTNLPRHHNLPDKPVTVTFELGNNYVVLTRINGFVAFVHQNYAGAMPRPGETWRVMVTGQAPSRKNPGKSVYFVKPISCVTGQREIQAVEYDVIINEVAKNNTEYQDCLAAIRNGLVAPDAAALADWLQQRLSDDARRRNNAAQRTKLARALLHQYGFKILREIVMPNGEYAFITHQQYDAHWYPQLEGEWLVVMTSPTRGYLLSMDCAGWYAMPNATDPKPTALAQNWNPTETQRRLRWDIES